MEKKPSVELEKKKKKRDLTIRKVERQGKEKKADLGRKLLISLIKSERKKKVPVYRERS